MKPSSKGGLGGGERTPLRNSVDVLLQLLGLRRRGLRVGQLRVDVVGDGLNRCAQRGAAAAAQVAGS